MVIRSVAEKHLGRCGGQGGDFLEVRKELFPRLVPLAELWKRGRLVGNGHEQMNISSITLRFIYIIRKTHLLYSLGQKYQAPIFFSFI